MDKKFTPFLKPNEVLSDEQIDHLREKSDLKGIGLLFMLGLLSFYQCVFFQYSQIYLLLLPQF